MKIDNDTLTYIRTRHLLSPHPHRHQSGDQENCPEPRLQSRGIHNHIRDVIRGFRDSQSRYDSPSHPRAYTCFLVRDAGE